MEIKILSSLAKVFPDEIYSGTEITSLCALLNEKTAFQLAFKSEYDEEIAVTSDNENVTLFKQQFVPVGLAAPEEHDDFFIRNAESGDYPDVLIELCGRLCLKAGEWTAVWCEFNAVNKGENTVCIKAGDKSVSVKCFVSDCEIGNKSLICTHWFHTDCLADYYNVPVFSDAYWQIVANYMAFAAQHGINLILTPLFTPPLDTEVGGERPTVQLVDVTVVSRGKYAFGFDNFKKWVKIALENGIMYFEMSHLFTQWGAYNAPKIIAKTKNGEKRIFGWETNAHGKAYTSFLRQLAPELIKCIDELGIRERCIFHASDEPDKKHYFSYKKAAAIINELFGEFKIIDALSEFEYYKRGIVKCPVPCIAEIEKFFAKVPELWTYFCCNPYTENYPNRFIAMPSLRTRIMGVIMYKYNVKGFLHWGYNFYYTQYSKNRTDPYKTTDAGGAFSSGDSFVVYPAEDGTPRASLRLKVFYEAMQDYEALFALQKKIGREKTVALIDEGLNEPISANRYPHDEGYIIALREKINKALSE